LTERLSIALLLLMVLVKKNGKLFLFLGSNVFCKVANLYFALVRIKRLIAVDVHLLFLSIVKQPSEHIFPLYTCHCLVPMVATFRTPPGCSKKD